MNCVQTARECGAVRSVVLLGASAKLRIASVRFLLSVCMSVYKQ
jgi:hypothetical protein